MLDKVERLKIAFVTDIHLNKKGIQKLAQWVNIHYNTQTKFDYCLIGGDTANCNHDKLDHSQQQMFNSTIQTHKSIKDIFSCKLFFVPGNHDCKYFFNHNAKAEHFYNMHLKRLEITQGLDIVGFGGSIPGYVQGKEYWTGYPFKNDNELAAQWEKLNNMDEKNKNQVILLTHIGPNLSETTLDRSSYPQKTVATGSDYFNKFIGRSDILCWLHGHTHNGSNNAKIAGTQIINAGPLAYNQFMYFQIIKENMRWRINKKSYQIL